MRRVAIILAAIVAVLAVADYLVWRASHTRLIALAERSGLSRRSPGIVRDLERETVATRAATRLAGSLLELETDRAWLAELDAAEQAKEIDRGLERLRLASQLAEELVRRRPASWQVATVLGASRFLLASRQRRWDRPHSTWRRPLRAAMRLAPSQPEPALLLAGAELSRWFALSADERRQVLPVLSRALEVSPGPDLLLPSWVRLAPSLETLLAAIPDRLEAWERLGIEFRGIGDLERYAIARQRWRALLPGALAERIAQARTRLRGGDHRSARGLAGLVIAAPHDVALAPSFSTALEILPAEAVAGYTAEHLHRWLAWALDLCVLERCPLDAETLARLAAVVPGLADAEGALATLAAGERTPPESALAEGTGDDPPWNRYWIFRAQRLATSDPEGARAALDRASPQPPDRLRYWRAAETLARAAGDEPARARARDQLTPLARSTWSAEEWQQRGSLLRLELLAPGPASELRLTATAIRAAGAALELRWDGRAVGVVAFPADGTQSWRLAIEPGVHLVEIEDLLGATPRPRTLSLETRPAGG